MSLSVAINGVVIVVLAMLAFDLVLRGKDYGSKADDYESKCSACLAIAARKKDSEPQQKPGYCQPEQPNWCDLAAQYRSAAAAESSRYAAWFAFFAALYGVFLLKETLREAAKTTRVAQEVGEQAEKAMLLVTSVNYDFIHQSFGVCLEHFGKTPAFSTTISVRLFITINPKNPRTAERIHYSENSFGRNHKGMITPESDAVTEHFPFTFIFKNIERDHGEGIPVGVWVLQTIIRYDDVFTVGTKRQINVVQQEFTGSLHDSVPGQGHGWSVAISRENRDEHDTR